MGTIITGKKHERTAKIATRIFQLMAMFGWSANIGLCIALIESRSRPQTKVEWIASGLMAGIGVLQLICGARGKYKAVKGAAAAE